MSSAEEEGENCQGERETEGSPRASSDVSPEPLSLQDVGVRFQFCIAAVEDLEREREELVRELSLLREPSLEAVRQAHEEIVRAFGERARVELERDTLKEEIRLVRRRLFRVTRECVASQYQLERQKQELTQKEAEQESLETLAARLTEELNQLRNTFAQQRESQHQRLRAPHPRYTPCEFQDRRRLSVELQSLIEEQHSSLEEHYEPRLMQLLERTERGAKALQAAQEELQKLQEEIRPLEAAANRLRVEKNCLQEQIALLKRKKEDEALLYRLFSIQEMCPSQHNLNAHDILTTSFSAGSGNAAGVSSDSCVHEQIDFNGFAFLLLVGCCKNHQELQIQPQEQLQELEDTKREMKISVQLQQHHNKEIEELRKSLAQELAIYKGCLELYGQLFRSVAKKE